MVSKTSKYLDQLMILLKTRCFIQAKSSPSNSSADTNYSFGHAGSLFRRNLIQEWWNSMVVRNGNVYVVDDQPSLHMHSPNRDQTSILSETSQVGLHHFTSNLEVNHGKVPFSIAQVSTTLNNPTDDDVAFTRNPEKCIMLSQQFVGATSADKWFDQCQRSRLKWWRQFSSNGSKFTTSDPHTLDCGSTQIHLQYQSPWGPVTMETLSNHGDRQLELLEQTTGQSCQVKQDRKTSLPYLIECETSLERAMLVYLVDAYDTQSPTVVEKLKSDDQNSRCILNLHHRLSPYKVSVVISKFSTSVKDLRSVADHVTKELRTAGVHVFDPPDNSSLEARFTTGDELGVPFSVVIRESTLGDGIVHMRHRDTTLSEKVHITELKSHIVRAIRTL